MVSQEKYWNQILITIKNTIIYNLQRIWVTYIRYRIVSYWNLYVVDGDDSKAYDSLTWDMSNNDFVDKSLMLCSEIIQLKEDLNTLIERRWR